MKKSLILSSILVFALFLLVTPLSAAEKNVILVLDTSLSMVGKGGKDIMGQVKDSISNYIDTLEKGDRVTFMTFDTDVRVYPTVEIEDTNDRDILKKYISMTEATGKWTHTLEMMKSVFEKADELSKSEEERQPIIVVMTDGLDDPPPGEQDATFNIKSVTSPYKETNWWIYFISFSELKNSENMARIREQLEGVSDKTTIIEAGTPAEGIEGQLVDDIGKREAESRSLLVPLLVAGGAALVVIIILLILWYFYGTKVTGYIEYWNEGVLGDYAHKADLERFKSRDVVVGRGGECDVNIRDLESTTRINIRATRKGLLIIPLEGGYEMVNREDDGTLQDGDVVKMDNIGFRYFGE
jgi:uncharacterized protein YegL